MAAATSSSPHFSEASENDDEEQPSPPPMSEATSPHFSDVGVDDDPASPAHFQDRVLEAQTLALEDAAAWKHRALQAEALCDRATAAIEHASGLCGRATAAVAQARDALATELVVAAFDAARRELRDEALGLAASPDADDEEDELAYDPAPAEAAAVPRNAVALARTPGPARKRYVPVMRADDDAAEKRMPSTQYLRKQLRERERELKERDQQIRKLRGESVAFAATLDGIKGKYESLVAACRAQIADRDGRIEELEGRLSESRRVVLTPGASPRKKQPLGKLVSIDVNNENAKPRQSQRKKKAVPHNDKENVRPEDHRAGKARMGPKVLIRF